MPGEFVRLDDGEVFVRTAAPPGATTGTDGDAAPAVFVHGFGGSSTNWTDLMHLLSSAGSGPGPALWCDALDLPGFGQSLPSEVSCSVSGQAATVAALIEARGRGPVHLFGNSLGGAVCTRVAATRPELIRSLTLIAPAMPDLLVRPATARFPALCVPKFGGWLLSRVQKMSPQARVEASIATIYFDGSCVHPDRIAVDIAEIERRDQLCYGLARWSAARGLSWPSTCASARPAVARRRPGQCAGAYHLRQRRPDRGSWDGLPRARTFRRARVVGCPRTGHVAEMSAWLWWRPSFMGSSPGMSDCSSQLCKKAPGGRRTPERAHRLWRASSRPPLVSPAGELSVDEVSATPATSSPDVATTGQKRLKNVRRWSSAPVARLTRSAVPGRRRRRDLGIDDFDVVDESNLERQTIHGASDVGHRKAESARAVSARSTRT